MPKDWKPKDPEVQRCRQLGLDVELLAESFRDYWLTRGELRADWDAAFRNNIRSVSSNPRLLEQFTASPTAAAAPKPQKVHGPPAPMPTALRDRIKLATTGTAAPALALLKTGGDPPGKD